MKRSLPDVLRGLPHTQRRRSQPVQPLQVSRSLAFDRELARLDARRTWSPAPLSERSGRAAPTRLSSTQRARACSVKGHHYKNKSLTSSGLTQPSVSCANLTASRPPSAKRQGEVVAPYADGAPAPAAPVTPRQNSARDHYQKAMSARSVLVEGDAKVSDDRGRPRGTSSPSQQVQPAVGDSESQRSS
eukprot:Skav202117  [mRNA]  locus=scaffold1980:133391:138052:+ [translate_table: standard]